VIARVSGLPRGMRAVRIGLEFKTIQSGGTEWTGAVPTVTPRKKKSKSSFCEKLVGRMIIALAAKWTADLGTRYTGDKKFKRHVRRKYELLFRQHG
jgi:hypothetical protein